MAETRHDAAVAATTAEGMNHFEYQQRVRHRLHSWRGTVVQSVYNAPEVCIRWDHGGTDWVPIESVEPA